MDWLACAFEILGAILIGNKNIWGFPVLMVAGVFWFATGWELELHGLMLISIIFLVINARNIKKWRGRNGNY